MESLAANLCCQVATLRTKCLGLPLGARNKEPEVWGEVWRGVTKDWQDRKANIRL